MEVAVAVPMQCVEVSLLVSAEKYMTNLPSSYSASACVWVSTGWEQTYPLNHIRCPNLGTLLLSPIWERTGDSIVAL